MASTTYEFSSSAMVSKDELLVHGSGFSSGFCEGFSGGFSCGPNPLENAPIWSKLYS